MKLRSVLLVLIAVITISLGVLVPIEAQTSDQNYGFVQFAHAGTDAPAVDIYAKGNQTPLVTNLAYGQVTSFVAVPTTVTGFTVREAGSGAGSKALYDGPFGVKGNVSLLITLVGLQSDKSLSLEPVTIVRTNPKGKALVRIFNAVKGGPLLTLQDDKGMLQTQASKFLTVGDSQLAAGTYTFNLVTGTNNQSVANMPSVTIDADKVYTFILISDQASNSSVKILLVVSPQDTTHVTFSNQGLKPVDLYAPGTDKPIAANLAIAGKSDPITVLSGDGLFNAYDAGSPAQGPILASIATRLRPGHDLTIAYDGSKQMKVIADVISPELTSNPTMIDTSGAAPSTAVATMAATSPAMDATMSSTATSN